jgi:dCTP deaminase
MCRAGPPPRARGTNGPMPQADPRAAALKMNIARRKAQAAARESAPVPGLLADHQIRALALESGMIAPFEEAQKRDGVISYGLSSYGYDARAAREFKIFTNVDNAIVDPKDFSRQSFVDRETDVCVIPPNSFALTRTVEHFCVPEDVLVVCLGKSTYARCGLIVNVTPLEPGWRGHVTLEISNTTPLPARVYAGEGIAQFLFFRGAAPCDVSYAARGGKYMGQTGVTLPKL